MVLLAALVGSADLGPALLTTLTAHQHSGQRLPGRGSSTA